MTALTKDRNTPKKPGHKKAIPVAANAKIYAGSMVCSNANGYAVPGTDTAGLKFEGIAQEYVDNTGGTDGAKTIEVEQPVIVQMAAAGMTQADRGKPAFIADDQTVALSTTNAVSCGIIREVESSTKVWLDTFYLHHAQAQAAIAADDAAQAAGANPTKAEYDAAVALINETKSVVNGLLTKLKNARIMGS
ncbi:MAG: hypothetical protein QHH10_12045 [Peptococcaceae bacterium]|jgi:hypothetical protein|nr:hypothetical protein [Peptococcaceae bacterium]MDH7526035.1 hypothetical protein [Peptococcaceae bacterium]